MSERIQSILFLSVFGIILIGFISVIFYTIINKLTSKSKIKKLADKFHWKYYRDTNNDSSELQDMNKILKQTLYQTRPGLTQKIFQIIHGSYLNFVFWFAYYHGFSKNHLAGKGYNQDLSIFIVPRVKSGPEYIYCTAC